MITTTTTSASPAVLPLPTPAAGAVSVRYEVCNPPHPSYPAAPKESGRARNWRRRAKAHRLDTVDPVTKKYPRRHWCGKPLLKDGVVELVKTESGAIMPAHTEFCGSPWACPVCGSIIRRARGREIAEGLNNWVSAGHGVYFVTVTIRHHIDDALKDMLDLISDTWRRVVRGDPWKRIKDRAGLVGYTRTLEITFGLSNGWHPHLHFLMYADEPANAQVAAYLRAQIEARFTKFLAKAGAIKHLPDAVHGVDVRPVAADGSISSLGMYVSKMADAMAAEMSASDAKNGRLPAHMSPFQLLDLSDGWAVNAWREYVEGTKGKRSIYYSRGMRDKLGLDAEKDDQTIVDEETETKVEVSGAIDADLWADIVDADAWQQLDKSLTAAARGDWHMAACELGVTLGMIIDTETGQQIPLLC